MIIINTTAVCLCGKVFFFRSKKEVNRRQHFLSINYAQQVRVTSVI